MPVPVIARIPGWCLGGGLEVALACDMRLSDDSAMFGMPEVKVGIPSVIHAALLPRLLGQARADWLLLCCENIDAARAEAWGLVHERCAVGQLDELVNRRAQALAALPPQALRQQKRLLRHWQTVPLAQAVRDSIGEFAQAYATGEPQALMGEFMARKAAKRRRVRVGFSTQPAAMPCGSSGAVSHCRAEHRSPQLGPGRLRASRQPRRTFADNAEPAGTSFA